MANTSESSAILASFALFRSVGGSSERALPACRLALRNPAVANGLVAPTGDITCALAHHDLPAEAALFGYDFDLNSTAIRKNPMGALEAFQLAIPLAHLPATFGREINNHPLSN